jgi:hypothetical protein
MTSSRPIYSDDSPSPTPAGYSGGQELESVWSLSGGGRSITVATRGLEGGKYSELIETLVEG